MRLFNLCGGSGLAIRDALTLKRDEVVHDKTKKLYRVTTARQKTGTHVSVPIPEKVAVGIVRRGKWKSGLRVLVRQG